MVSRLCRSRRQCRLRRLRRPFLMVGGPCGMRRPRHTIITTRPGIRSGKPPAAHRSAGAEYHAGQPGVSGPAQPAWEDASLPPELRRELKRQAQRGGGQVPSFVGSAPVVTQQDFWNGEKHQEYTSMASAFHVPMNVCHPQLHNLRLPVCSATASACSLRTVVSLIRLAMFFVWNLAGTQPPGSGAG